MPNIEYVGLVVVFALATVGVCFVLHCLIDDYRQSKRLQRAHRLYRGY